MGESTFLLQVDHCDRLLIIRDQYPKSKTHLLIIARDPQLLDISCLRGQHVPLLRYMRSQAEKHARIADSSQVREASRVLMHV